jgi:hypothetical protein
MANSKNDNYASYDNFDSYSYKMIQYLMDNNEEIWKLLYYKTPTAWNEPNLTKAQKGALVYDGSDDTSRFNVFLDQGAPDVVTREDCILRISPHSIFPDNRIYGTVSLILESYCHFKINHLSNYKTRLDVITKELLKTFNGVTIDGLGIGAIYFDRLASESNRLEWGGQIPWKGRWMILSNKST